MIFFPRERLDFVEDNQVGKTRREKGKGKGKERGKGGIFFPRER